MSLVTTVSLDEPLEVVVGDAVVATITPVAKSGRKIRFRIDVNDEARVRKPMKRQAFPEKTG